MEVLIGKQVGLLRSMASGRVISLIVGVSVFATVISCASEIVPTVGDAEVNSTPVTEVTVSAEFNADSFAAINPQPEIRELDLEIDLGFYEREAAASGRYRADLHTQVRFSRRISVAAY
jgi:hypothetical protein